MKSLLLSLVFIFTALFLQAHPPWGIVVDKHRNIYFPDLSHNGRGSVWKLSNDGKLTLLLKDFHAHNVSLDENGNLITAHGEENHTMIRLNKDGSMDTLIHSLDLNIFFGGNCTYTPKGEILFGLKKHIWRITKEGGKEKVSDFEFGWNQAIYADDEGNYYGPDIGNGKGKLIKITPNGEASVLADNLITKLPRGYDRHNDVLLGITKGCEGNMYIGDLAGRRIVKILDSGKVETFYTSEQDWSPTAIDFFAGDAYILEYKTSNGLGGPRIVKIAESTGKREVLLDYDKRMQEDVRQNENNMERTGSPKEEGVNLWWIIVSGAGVIALILLVRKVLS